MIDIHQVVNKKRKKENIQQLNQAKKKYFLRMMVPVSALTM